MKRDCESESGELCQRRRMLLGICLVAQTRNQTQTFRVNHGWRDPDSPAGNLLGSEENMIRWCKLPYLRLVAVLVAIVVNCLAQKVTSTLDTGFDFKSAKHYAWGQNHIITRQGRANDAWIGEKIVQEVNRVLAAKGFIEDPTRPDFYISYDAGASNMTLAVEGA